MTNPPLSELLDALKEHGGMTQYEASVYLALVRNGKIPVSKLPEKCDVPTGRVYDIVNDLHADGFVEIIDGHPKKAYAVDPEEALTPILDRIERTQSDLVDLYESVEDVEGGISLFKSRATVQKYMSRVINVAEHDLFLLTPYELLDTVREDLAATVDNVDVHLVISDLDVDYEAHDAIYLDDDIDELGDRVRGITSNESFAVVADRQVGLYWTGATNRPVTEESQAFYITNPEFSLLLDRFISESLWPIARPINPAKGREDLSFPAEYTRIRQCLVDLKRATQHEPMDAFEVEFEGYDTSTGEKVRKRGTLAGYYFTEYDIRATLTLDVDGGTDGNGETVTVGGWKASYEDYSAKRLIVRREHTGVEQLTDETKRYLRSCREDLPTTFGGERLVFGFEGFVDRMRKLNTDGGSGRMNRFESFKEAIVHFEATDARPELEWEYTETNPGGKAHMASVFDTLGYDVTLIGNFGTPIHEAFNRRFDDDQLVSIAEPLYVDYITFENGKLLLSESGSLDVTWDRLLDVVGVDGLVDRIDGTRILSLGAWSRMPESAAVWDGLATEVWPRLDDPPETVHITPGQVQALSPRTVRDGVAVLQELDDSVDVLLIANTEQTDALLTALGEEAPTSTIQQRALRARDATELSQYVAHTNEESAMAIHGDVSAAQAPTLPSGEYLLNSDAHFASGVLLGRTNGLNDGASLVLGHAVASFFMIHNRGPTPSELHSVIERYDADPIEEPTQF